jgi:carbonyl reductase 1
MSKKLIVVTGANRGIGQGIIQLLAKTQHQPPLTIYATSRAGSDLGIQTKYDNEIHYSKLDVGDKSSITAFLQSTLKDNPHIDVLINNAGINNNNNETAELAAQTIDVNYRGTKAMCELFLSQGGMSRNNGSRMPIEQLLAAGAREVSRREIYSRHRRDCRGLRLHCPAGPFGAKGGGIWLGRRDQLPSQ